MADPHPASDLQALADLERKILWLATWTIQGLAPMLRFNCTQPPCDNPAVRRAVLGAIDHTEFMEAYSGDRSTWHVKLGAFCPGTPMDSDAGMADLLDPAIDATS